MAMELPDGKTARNIQEQVKFLTEKLKDLYARVNNLEVKIVKVDELPEEGEFGTIYLLPVEDPEEGNYFKEYIYFDGEWELIGKTRIDLSGYVDLTSAQTITGVKTLTNGIIFEATSAGSYKLETPNNYYLDFNYYDEGGTRLGAALYLQYGAIVNTKEVRPQDDDTYSLGSASTKYKDLYLSGNINIQNPNYSGTHSQIFESQYGRLFFKTDGSNAMEIQSANIVFSRSLIGNNLDIGSSTYKWKDLYLSGSAYIGTGNRIYSNDTNKIILNNGSDYTYWDGSDLKTTCNILPYYNNTGNIGSASAVWNYAYVNNLSNGTGDLFCHCDFLPSATNILALGNSTYKWKNLYLSGNLTDGTNSVSVAQIASGLGGTYRHRLLIANIGETFELSIDISSSTAITTLAGLAPYVGKIEGAFAYHTVGSSYDIVMIDSIDTTSEELDYQGSQGLDTATQIDVQADIVVQL